MILNLRKHSAHGPTNLFTIKPHKKECKIHAIEEVVDFILIVLHPNQLKF
jgi:hypothetical protein